MNEGVAWRAEIELAISGWRRGSAQLYAAGHGFFHQLIRSASPQAARALHDAGVRKPVALSPLHVDPVAGGVARGRLTVSAWDTGIVQLVDAALLGSLSMTGEVRGCPAIVTNVHAEPKTSLAKLIPTGEAPSSIMVLFASPTFFSIGRRLGRQHYGLLPLPELVVSSWLRSWRTASGPAFEIDTSESWLSDRIVIHEVRGLETRTVDGGKTALTGFEGKVRYAWCGPEPWGPALLAALARFARYCGTGAKTGYGFGMTTPFESTAGTSQPPEHHRQVT